jgi:hypothetical protein
MKCLVKRQFGILRFFRQTRDSVNGDQIPVCDASDAVELSVMLAAIMTKQTARRVAVPQIAI